MNEAIARGDLEAFEILLATAAHDASQLLARVAACGSLRMLEVLLTAPGVDPNARVRAPGCAFDGGTALHFAVSSFEPRDDHVRALVAAGADANAELPCGLRALDVANLARTRSLLASLGGQRAPHKATTARSTFRTTLRLLVALQRNDFAEMRLAIAAGADPNTADMLGNTSLHQAVLQLFLKANSSSFSKTFCAWICFSVASFCAWICFSVASFCVWICSLIALICTSEVLSNKPTPAMTVAGVRKGRTMSRSGSAC
jgi:hypothetical protein